MEPPTLARAKFGDESGAIKLSFLVLVNREVD